MKSIFFKINFFFSAVVVPVAVVVAHSSHWRQFLASIHFKMLFLQFKLVLSSFICNSITKNAFERNSVLPYFVLSLQMQNHKNALKFLFSIDITSNIFLRHVFKVKSNILWFLSFFFLISISLFAIFKQISFQKLQLQTFKINTAEEGEGGRIKKKIFSNIQSVANIH